MTPPTHLERFLQGDPTERFSLGELREIFGEVREQRLPVDTILDRMKSPEEVKFDA